MHATPTQPGGCPVSSEPVNLQPPAFDALPRAALPFSTVSDESDLSCFKCTSDVIISKHCPPRGQLQPEKLAGIATWVTRRS